MNRIKITLPTLVSSLLLLPAVVSAQIITVCNLYNILVKFKNVFVGVVAIFAILSLLYAAFLFLTGGGNEETQKKAKSFLLYGIIGIAIALFAFVAVPSIGTLLGLSASELQVGCTGF